MAKSFTGAEFLKALSEGSLKEAITAEGIVKLDPNDHHTILFSKNTSCAFWTKLPVEIIEKVDYLTAVHCQDHEYPLVRLHLKEPPADNKLASVFAHLVRRSYPPQSQDATVAPFSPRETTVSKVTAVRVVFHTLDDDKDWDTELAMYVYGPRRNLVAQRDRQLGKFRDGTNIAFDLTMFDTLDEDEIDASFSTLEINPNGDDTWRFDYEIDFFLEDGRAVGRKFIHRSLSEDKVTETYRMQDAIPLAPDRGPFDRPELP
jgi:hypothetical protein